jgi:2-dehydro-3-deoxyphosphogluconate aldolase/(4S)-4-hydroxy-2-oxoglutarate aldolase
VAKIFAPRRPVRATMVDALNSAPAASQGAARAEHAIRACRIIAIVRVPLLDRESVMGITETLVRAGIRALEFPLTMPNALEAVSAAREVAGPSAIVGAGTVLAEAEVEQAAAAGAQFIVSPDVNSRVIQATRQREMLSMPGAFTATEVCQAIQAGAHMVKLFPAGPAGVDYLKALRGPLPYVPFVPTGGIEVEAIPQFLAVGAVAVALGSALVSSVQDLDGLAARSRRAVALTGGHR